ncbi:MAG: hypothetical protein ACOYIF_06590 [Acetivibrionales bacterium]
MTQKDVILSAAKNLAVLYKDPSLHFVPFRMTQKDVILSAAKNLIV